MANIFPRINAIPTSEVLRAFFPDVVLKRDGANEKALCVFHDEKTPSLTVYQSGFKCFGCGASGNNVELLIKAGLAELPLDAAKMIADKFGIPIDSRKPRRQKPLTLVEYATFLNIPQDYLADTFHLEEMANGIGIPYQDENLNQVSVQMRHRLEKRKGKDNRFSWKEGKPFLYGVWALPVWKEKGNEGVILCEGASDVQVCWFNDVPTLGIPGASNFKKEWTHLLCDFSEIAIIKEPGEAGKGFVDSIATALKEKNYPGRVKAVTLPEKDPRDLWLKNPAEFKQQMEGAVQAASVINLYPKIPLTANLIFKIAHLLSRHVFFKDRRIPLLISIWILGTYLYELFSYYGYLWINSPVRRCAKTLLEDVLSHLCYKASSRLSNATESVIFRLADEGGTLILDELENLRGQDREKYGMVMSVLNNGFQAGGKVPRTERGEGGVQVVYFNTFCPKTLAGINRLVDTIEDRAFKIPMVRKARNEKVERFSLRKQGRELEALRDEIALWAEARGKVIEALYDAMDEIEQLAGLDDRFKDISEPLAVIASYADAEAIDGQLRILPELTALLSVMAGKRDELERREAIVAFISIAEGFLGSQADMFVETENLLTAIKQIEDLCWIESAKALATFLRKFELSPKPNPSGKFRGYKITREWLNDIKNRYSAFIPESEVSDVSESQSGHGFESDSESVSEPPRLTHSKRAVTPYGKRVSDTSDT